MTTVYDPLVDASLAEISAQLGSLNPDLREFLASLSMGTMTEAEAMQKVLEIMRDNPALVTEIEGLAMTALQQLPVLDESLRGIVVPSPSGVGLPRLDPNYEAALMERVHFDGDVPELRFGALPRDSTPAVPVDTDALNPIVVGMMLEKAAQEVLDEAKQIEESRVTEVQGLLEGATEEQAALVLREPANLAKLDRNTLPDPVGYERGQVPALRQVEEPTGWGLGVLSEEERRQYAWKTLSTTQGRRSMVKVIRDLLAGALLNDQYEVIVLDGELRRINPENFLAYAEWTADMSGPNSMQASFAFADVAWRSMLGKLEDQVAPEGQTMFLEVASVNTVNVRQVGFCARLHKAP